MIIKRIYVCQDCQSFIRDELEPINESKFRDLCVKYPDSYNFELGPDYQGVCFDTTNVCVDCG